MIAIEPWPPIVPVLRLDLDELYTEGYYYTEFDIGGAGHSITIKASDKEAFLDAFVAEWRKRVERMLLPYDPNAND